MNSFDLHQILTRASVLGVWLGLILSGVVSLEEDNSGVNTTRLVVLRPRAIPRYSVNMERGRGNCAKLTVTSRVNIC
jgi:hypothetical protein